MMHIHRIMAVFEKDLKDFMKNMMLLTMPLLPIFLALLYNQMGDSEELPVILIYILVGTSFAAVSSSCMMTMMAEENEKKTLRGLMLSPASFFDIIVGKSLVTGLMTLISLGISLWIVNFNPFISVRAVIGLILLFAFFLLLGIAVGLFAKSVASTSAYMIPILILFGFTPIIERLGFDEESAVIKIADVFPIMQAIEIHDTDSWLPLGVIFLWVVGAAIFTVVCFRKNMTDD